MKKFISVICVVLIVVLSFSAVNAAESVSFALDDCECKSNRLFSVDMVAKSSSKLSAAMFEFSYDKDMFMFKDIKTDGAKIVYNDNGSTIKADFLCASGKDINNGEVIFTLTFKALKSGTGYIDFKTYDCVNSSAEFIDAGKCTSAKIVVSKTASENSDQKDKQGNSKKSENGDDKNGSKSSRENKDGDNSDFDDLGILNSIDDKSTRFLIIGIAIGVSVIAIAFIGYFAAKRVIKKKTQISKSTDNNDTNSDNNEKSSE